MNRDDRERGCDLRGSGAEPLRAEDPDRIGGIRLLGRLGAGGMGRVYLGVTEGRYAAVKQVLLPGYADDADFLRRFGHELDNLARLPEHVTAPLLAGDRDAAPPWFATAYVPGLTLAQALDLHGAPLPTGALWPLLREAATGLTAVHALDIVHRDLKPTNVMLTVDGVTLIDFGVARAADQSRLTRTDMAVGTPAYMAPEQALGGRELTPATDIFALGSLLAYAASGQAPFGEDSGPGVLYRVVHEEPDLAAVRERDPRLAELVAACLDKEPGRRPTAPEVVRIAEEQGPFERPWWPAALTERLAERAEFATRVPDEDELTAPAPAPVVVGGPVVRERRSTRIRVALTVVPVVVVAGATTLVLQLLPHTSDAPGDGASGAGPSVAVTASAGSTASASASAGTPSASASASGSGSASATPAVSASASAGAQPGVVAPGPAGGGAAPGGTGGTAGDSGGSTGGGSSDGSGGSGPSSDAGGATTPASPSTFRLRNSDTGQCLTQVYGSAGLGDCSGSTTTWTTRSAEDGGIKFVNTSSGACLTANMLGQAVFVGDCTQGASRLWAWGSGGTVRSLSNGGCLDVAFGGGPATNTCAAGKASQSWTRV